MSDDEDNDTVSEGHISPLTTAVNSEEVDGNDSETLQMIGDGDDDMSMQDHSKYRPDNVWNTVPTYFEFYEKERDRELCTYEERNRDI